MAAQLEAVKWIPGTKFLVDGFRFQSSECTAYFLTHAHSDHTTGLYRSWASGTIFCSPVTARLITEEMGIKRAFVKVVELNKPILVRGVTVTFLDANHCPGACMILFQVPGKCGEVQNVLHTGDFRFQPYMTEYPTLKSIQIHTLILDTTYAAAKWRFPHQDDVIQMMTDIMLSSRLQNPGACRMRARACHWHVSHTFRADGTFVMGEK